MSPLLMLLILVVLGSAAIAGYSAAPWVPTKPSERRYALAQLALTGNETVIDLGCGDGSLLFEVARQFPQARCIGYDISVLPLCIAWVRKLLFFRTYRNVSIRFGNLFTADVSSADVIFIFLLGKAYDRLKTKLAREVCASATIAVEGWPLPACTPHRTVCGERMLPVYIYRGEDLRKC